MPFPAIWALNSALKFPWKIDHILAKSAIDDDLISMKHHAKV
jgi:hypothetical protein